MESKISKDARNEKSFLWAVTLSKPGYLMRDPNKLRKSGLSQSEAKRIVLMSFIGSIALVGILFWLGLKFTRLAEGPFGPWPFLAISLLAWYINHYFLAKYLFNRAKSAKAPSNAT